MLYLYIYSIITWLLLFFNSLCYSIVCYFFSFVQGGDALPTGLISKRLGLSVTWDDCKMRTTTSGLLKHGAARSSQNSGKFTSYTPEQAGVIQRVIWWIAKFDYVWFIEHVRASREVGLSEKSGGESACSFWRVYDSPQAYTAILFLVDSKFSV